MSSFNKVILLGNLCRDPELRYLPNQTAVTDLTLAINHKYKTAQGEAREEVCFIDCTAFGKQAETLNQYCQKGKPLLVEGRLKYETWDDKQGGKRSKHKVVIDGFQFLGTRSDADDEQPQPATNYPRNRQTVQQGAPQQSPISDEQHFKEDDIPF